METLVIQPKDKAELSLLKVMLKKMAIKTKVISDPIENKLLKSAMLTHSKKFFINKMDK